MSGKEGSPGACLQQQLVTFCKLEPCGGAPERLVKPVEENFLVSADSTGSEALALQTNTLDHTEQLRIL